MRWFAAGVINLLMCHSWDIRDGRTWGRASALKFLIKWENDLGRVNEAGHDECDVDGHVDDEGEGVVDGGHEGCVGDDQGDADDDLNDQHDESQKHEQFAGLSRSPKQQNGHDHEHHVEEDGRDDDAVGQTPRVDAVVDYLDEVVDEEEDGDD